jgi:hypothetical protein
MHQEFFIKLVHFSAATYFYWLSFVWISVFFQMAIEIWMKNDGGIDIGNNYFYFVLYSLFKKIEKNPLFSLFRLNIFVVFLLTYSSFGPKTYVILVCMECNVAVFVRSFGQP